MVFIDCRKESTKSLGSCLKNLFSRRVCIENSVSKDLQRVKRFTLKYHQIISMLNLLNKDLQLVPYLILISLVREIYAIAYLVCLKTSKGFTLVKIQQKTIMLLEIVWNADRELVLLWFSSQLGDAIIGQWQPCEEIQIVAKPMIGWIACVLRF